MCVANDRSSNSIGILSAEAEENSSSVLSLMMYSSKKKTIANFLLVLKYITASLLFT